MTEYIVLGVREIPYQLLIRKVCELINKVLLKSS